MYDFVAKLDQYEYLK